MPGFRGRHIISIKDFSKEDLLYLMERVRWMRENASHDMLAGKVVGSLFFEPSTRTRLSFESATNRLGGKIVGFADAGVSSTKKGETLADTIRMVDDYADTIVMRHPIEGSARLASEVSSVPIINGGDGANQHPTQTFLDLFTIMETQEPLFDKPDKTLNVCFAGDLKYGRTVHSLVIALSLFNSRIFFLSPPSLAIPKHYLDLLDDKGVQHSEHADLKEILGEVDVLYATRIQAERFPDPIEYERVRYSYVLKAQMFTDARDNLRVLHPLPRVDEVETSVDDTPYAYYFEQAANGIPVRQALLALVLGVIQ